MAGAVGPDRMYQSVPHINAIGYVMIAVLAIVFLPLLPFAAVLWLLGQRTAPEPERPDTA